MTLHPQTAAAFAVTMEAQLLRVYGRLLTAETNLYVTHAITPIFRIDASELEEVLGTRHAYLTASTCKFTLDEDGQFWTRRRGPLPAETIEICPYSFETAARRARQCLDPHGVLKPFLAGLTNA